MDECTTITEPGTYVLERDLTAVQRDYCIIVEDADDVVFDAQGQAIDGQLKAAIYVVGSRNVTVRHVVSSAPSNYGIWVEESQHIRLEGNTIKQFQNQTVAAEAARRALFLSRSQYLLVRNNRIEGIGLRQESGLDSGLQFRHSESITITNNTIFGTSSAVSLVNSSDIRVRQNVMARNVYGIQMRRFSHDITVRENDIRHHTLCPMDVKNSSDILIDDNRMTSHAGLGLAINATNVTISNNLLKDSSSFGIIVATGSNRVDIHNNTVTDSSSLAGIGVFGRVSDVRIDNNTIADNAPHGILLKHGVSRVSIRNNSIYGNVQTGVTVRPRVDRILISHNRVYKNGERAIAIEVPRGVTLDGNYVNGEQGTQETPEKALTEASETRGQDPETGPREDGGQSQVTDAPGQVGFDHVLALGALALFAIFRFRSNRGW
ncbi:MAG: right-handed parallel beta-helix repeat-containing protein [Halobacteriales archaeon]|nr:right-handed parallel beta-helix repeat-containing protein [Halobacteriales archaeon]